MRRGSSGERRFDRLRSLAIVEPKGREALDLAVPPFFHHRPSQADGDDVSLGCCGHGSHPSGPTCAASMQPRSSAGRSGARSEQVRGSRAFTIPGSLARALLVLVPVKTGECCSGVGSAVGANGRRPSARCTVTTRGPPHGRAGGAVLFDAVLLVHLLMPPVPCRNGDSSLDGSPSSTLTGSNRKVSLDWPPTLVGRDNRWWRSNETLSGRPGDTPPPPDLTYPAPNEDSAQSGAMSNWSTPGDAARAGETSNSGPRDGHIFLVWCRCGFLRDGGAEAAAKEQERENDGACNDG